MLLSLPTHHHQDQRQQASNYPYCLHLNTGIKKTDHLEIS